MGEKSEQKREHILQCAKPVFARKGFRAVTMKDIVEACGISRGGLYLHFGGTESRSAAERPHGQRDPEGVCIVGAGPAV